MAKKGKTSLWYMWVISEAAFYFSVWYVLMLLNAGTANLWLSSLYLWILINVAILTCPVVKMCCKC